MTARTHTGKARRSPGPSPAALLAERNPTTAEEVARLAGVSQSTVSRVFTAGASVSGQTRARVERFAAELGYRPNLVARSLITGRSNMIGVAVPGTVNPFYQATLDALSIAFAEIGYRVLLFTTDPNLGSDPVLEQVLRYRVDALVLISTSLSSHFADECMQIRLPVVMLNRKTDSRLVSSVVGSNRGGAETIAAFLLAAGHKRFGYIAGLEQSSTSRDRELGFFDYLASKKVEAVQKQIGNYTLEGARAATRALLSSPAAPDAIFCANDFMALAAVQVAQAEFQLQVGRDVSVVGFDNIDMAGWPQFGLTTFSQPIARMVTEVVRIIGAQLARPEVAPVAVVEDGALIVRETARKPARGLLRQGDDLIWLPGDGG